MSSKGIKEVIRKILRLTKLFLAAVYKFFNDVWDSGVIQKYTRSILHYIKVFILKVIELSKILLAKVTEYSKILITKIIEFSKIFIAKVVELSKILIAKVIELSKVFVPKVVELSKSVADKVKELLKVYIPVVKKYTKLFSLKASLIIKQFIDFLRNFKFTLTNSFRILASVSVIGILFLLFFSYKVNYQRTGWEGDKKFRISQGQPFNDIADMLESEGVISNAFYFKVAAKIQGKDDKIISRTYILKTGYNNLELLEVLTDPSLNFTVKFTVVEGTRIKQIAKLSAAKFNFDEALFIKETQNDSLINILGLKGKINDLEGFLFPDTYKLPMDITPKEIVEVLFNEFYKKIIASDKYGMKDDPKKLLETVTLASIVQGETQLESEMPTIAGVYLNRIKKRMKLEADPTIQYALPDGPKQRLLRSDLQIESPYNTYKYYGLPPGPINNPGLKAIESVLNYEQHNYIFFVATGKGGHKFTATYKEHLEAVAEYRKNVKQK